MDKARQIIDNLNDYELITLCNDIYDWQTGNGDIDKDSKLYKMIHNNTDIFYSIDCLKELIVNEANNRFEKVVKILLVNQPWRYIK